VAELADAPDLGSGGQPWGFESPLSHSTAVPVNDSALGPVYPQRVGAAVDRAGEAHMAGLSEGVGA
jgi:hypothetical protein